MANNAASAVSSLRPPQPNIPRTRLERDRLADAAAEYVRTNGLVGPVSIEELQRYSLEVLERAGLSELYRDFAAILVNNAVWRDTVAGIPYEKRLLLLPKCLRDPDECPAQFDELGLLCEHCGRCANSEYKRQAEELGYAVLIAEGSPVVMSLIETGKIEAIIGISCLSVLERVFPYMEGGAVPGIAIPLLYDGCTMTNVDSDWVWDAIYLAGDEPTRRLDLDALRKQVDAWFSREALAELLPDAGQAESIALDWMAVAGKRWRPFLAACAYRALAEEDGETLSEELRKVAVAVECFHKASLIHDDIEDDDDIRYGEKTLHAQYGVPIALNVGDLLLGEGYRLLTHVDASAEVKGQLFAAAVDGHRDLCIGQGRELSWTTKPGLPTIENVLEIFEKKTAPAFEVALRFGAILAGADEKVCQVLSQYSRSLGVAYQIRDDIEDYYGWGEGEGLDVMRPSVLMAMAHESGNAEQRKGLERAWERDADEGEIRQMIRGVLTELRIDRPALNLMEAHKSRAIGALAGLRNSNLKSLLRRVISKIFGDFELMGCCDDHPTGHDRGGDEG